MKEKINPQGSLLVVVIVKNATLSFPNCKNFVAKSKQFIHIGMENTMALKHHSQFKYVYNPRSPIQ